MKKLIKPLGIISAVSFVLMIAGGIILLFTPMGVPAIYEGTNGFGVFDFRFSYTADNVMTIFSHYTGDRSTDWVRYYVIDFIFAFFAACFMISLPLRFYAEDDRHYLLFRASVFSALMTLLFNVIENILILRLLNITPYFSEGEADIASGITVLKWVFAAVWLGSSLLFIIATIIHGVRQKYRPRRLKK